MGEFRQTQKQKPKVSGPPLAILADAVSPVLEQPPVAQNNTVQTLPKPKQDTPVEQDIGTDFVRQILGSGVPGTSAPPLFNQPIPTGSAINTATSSQAGGVGSALDPSFLKTLGNSSSNPFNPGAFPEDVRRGLSQALFQLLFGREGV